MQHHLFLIGFSSGFVAIPTNVSRNDVNIWLEKAWERAGILMPSEQNFAPHFKRFVGWVLPEMLYEQHCLQYFDIVWR